MGVTKKYLKECLRFVSFLREDHSSIRAFEISVTQIIEMCRKNQNFPELSRKNTFLCTKSCSICNIASNLIILRALKNH